MLNDHNDKFDSGDDSEYHFSDEEVSYELEGEESQKPMSADSDDGKSGSSSSKTGLASKLPQSRRMLIAMVAFVALIFVVYKMIAPGSSVPSTDIADATPANTVPMPTTNNVANNAVPTVPTLPAAAPAPAQQLAPTVAQAPALPPQPPAVPVVPQVEPSTVTSSSPTLTVVTGPAPASLDQPAAGPQQAAAVAQSVLQSVTGAAASIGNQAAAPAVPSLPAVVPVQSPTAVLNPVTSAAVPSYTSDTNVDAKIASMTANNERMMGQLQGQYSQQMNDFATQNKALQDQVQSLTSRVSVMENQLNQLIQALTRRNQNSSMANPAAVAPVAAQPQAPDVKVAYNVQAIIPGRAWLKSDSGETLTVAEGDSIKDVGRVTKIDPYDGVVEINTGSKAISLSYGTGG